jgi:hypothetical protein
MKYDTKASSRSTLTEAVIRMISNITISIPLNISELTGYSEYWFFG